MQREQMKTGYTSITWGVLHKAEQTIRRFRGRNIKTLSSSDKDALIASMSAIIIASAQGVRPSLKWQGPDLARQCSGWLHLESIVATPSKKVLDFTGCDHCVESYCVASKNLRSVRNAIRTCQCVDPIPSIYCCRNCWHRFDTNQVVEVAGENG